MSGQNDNTGAPGIRVERPIFARYSIGAVRGKLWGAEPATSKNSSKSMICNANWWRGLVSNQRRHSQRIYSPSPLTTRAPLQPYPGALIH